MQEAKEKEERSNLGLESTDMEDEGKSAAERNDNNNAENSANANEFEELESIVGSTAPNDSDGKDAKESMHSIQLSQNSAHVVAFRQEIFEFKEN